MTAPVRLSTKIRCGDAYLKPSAYDSNSSRIGSSNAELNAWLVSSQSHRTPSAVNLATAWSKSPAGPDNTVFAPLYAATDKLGNWSVRLSTRSAAANTATIRPPEGKLPNKRPRSAISRAPSSRLNPPATQAAEY